MRTFHDLRFTNESSRLESQPHIASMPEYPNTEHMTWFQDEPIFRSHIAYGNNMLSYLGSISRSEGFGNPPTAEHATAFSSEGGAVSQSAIESTMECAGVDGETSPYCDGLGSSMLHQKWSGTSG